MSIDKLIHEVKNDQRSRIPYQMPSDWENSFEKWLTSTKRSRFYNLIKDEFISFKSGNQHHNDLHFQSFDNSFGLLYYSENKTELPESLFVLEDWKNKLKNENYVLSMSDLRYEKKLKEETFLFRYYLKPSRLKLNPGEQLYGNIEIVIKYTNGAVDYLKLLVNSYSDTNFKPAEDIGHLIFLLSE